MNRLIIEQGYLDEVLNVFAFAQESSFTQISTVEKVNDAYLPKSRTVLLFHLPDHSAFILLVARVPVSGRNCKPSPG